MMARRHFSTTTSATPYNEERRRGAGNQQPGRAQDVCTHRRGQMCALSHSAKDQTSVSICAHVTLYIHATRPPSSFLMAPPTILPSGPAPNVPMAVNTMAKRNTKPAEPSRFKVVKKAAPPKKSNGRRMRDMEKELLDSHGSLEVFLENALPLANVKHLKPLAVSTINKLIRVKRLYLQFFSFVMKSQEAAIATLKEGAPLPDMAQIKMFIRNAAIQGRSGLGKGFTGWNYNTTMNFCHDFLAMVSFESLSLETLSEFS
jgi:hypothetical protein